MMTSTTFECDRCGHMEFVDIAGDRPEVVRFQVIGVAEGRGWSVRDVLVDPEHVLCPGCTRLLQLLPCELAEAS